MNPLDNLHITPEFLRIISDLDEFKGRWSELSKPAPERLSILRPILSCPQLTRQLPQFQDSFSPLQKRYFQKAKKKTDDNNYSDCLHVKLPIQFDKIISCPNSTSIRGKTVKGFFKEPLKRFLFIPATFLVFFP